MSNEAKSLAKDIITELSDAVPGFDELWRKTEPINRIMAHKRILVLAEGVIDTLYQEIIDLEKQIAAGDSQS